MEYNANNQRPVTVGGERLWISKRSDEMYVKFLRELFHCEHRTDDEIILLFDEVEWDTSEFARRIQHVT